MRLAIFLEQRRLVRFTPVFSNHPLVSTLTMFPTASLTAFLFLAVSFAANPIVVRKAPVSLPFARHLNITEAQDVVLRGQARAKNLVSARKASAASPEAAGSVSATNVGVVYQASVGVGSPVSDAASNMTYTLRLAARPHPSWIAWTGLPFM
jgi:hypothetical protein